MPKEIDRDLWKTGLHNRVFGFETMLSRRTTPEFMEY